MLCCAPFLLLWKGSRLLAVLPASPPPTQKGLPSFELAVLHDELRSVVRRRLPGASRQNLGLRFLAAELTQTGGEGQVSGTESQFRMHRIS
jgi:hypothetical protein